MKPIIAIIDWQASPVSEPAASVEKEVIGDVAEVRQSPNAFEEFNPAQLGHHQVEQHPIGRQLLHQIKP